MELSNELSIGNLLLRASTNEIVKRVISAFDPDASRSVNRKSLGSLKLELLEPCAEFLGIELSDTEDNKVYTKDTLVSRVVFELSALLPSECSDCNERYVVELEPENKPLFHCHMCFRGAHSCASVTALHTALSSCTQFDLLSRHVWLCKACKESSFPIQSRKRKTRHDSIKNTDSRSSSLNARKNLSQDNSHSLVIDERTVNDSALRAKLENVRKGQVCQNYKKGKCLHGLRGKKEINGQVCELEHPKYCSRFCRFGTHKKYGCTKGSNCEFCHPVLCKFSVRSKLCTNSDCTFIHLKGTRRKAPSQKENSTTSRQAGTVNSSSTSNDPTSEADYKSSFLELARLVDRMQTAFMRELADIRSSLTPYPSYPQNQLHMPYLQPRSGFPQCNIPYPAQFPQAPGLPSGVTIPPASS